MVQADELQHTRCLIIAALACDPCDDVERVRKLVVEARDAGADIVKLTGKISQSSSTDQGSLSVNDLKSIIKTTEGVEVLIAPYDLEVVRQLSSMDFRGWKIEPELLTHLLLLKEVASNRRFLVAGLAGCTRRELQEALVRLPQDVVLLHTLLHGESDIEVIDVAHMVALRNHGRRVGYADNGIGKNGALLAVTLGATVLEKPLTCTVSGSGSGKPKGLQPDEFRMFVESVRSLELVLASDGLRDPLPDELDTIDQDRVSIVASQIIPRGTVIHSNMLTFKTPGIGLAPRFLPVIEGHSALYDIPEGAFVTFGVID